MNSQSNLTTTDGFHHQKKKKNMTGGDTNTHQIEVKII
jgi:hypothetical protein